MSGKYKPQFPRVAQLKTVELFRSHLEKEVIDLAFDAEVISGPDSFFCKKSYTQIWTNHR